MFEKGVRNVKTGENLNRVAWKMTERSILGGMAGGIHATFKVEYFQWVIWGLVYIMDIIGRNF